MHDLWKIAGSSLVLCLLGVGFAQVREQPKSKESPAAPAQPTPKKESATKSEDAVPVSPGSDDDGVDAEEAAIRQSAESFVKAYNDHDAKAVSELFAVKAEFLDEEGNLVKGREAIEQDFAQMFEDFPDCKIEIEIDSIRVLTPNLALEEGVVRGEPIPDETETLSQYIAVHVKLDGDWRIASVSDTEAVTEEITPSDHLRELAWMEGDWMDESSDSIMKSSCRWDDSGNYLLHDFVVRIDGGLSASGSMRIGWDPLTRQIKSWTFDADSGYTEGLWTRIDNEWIVNVRGVNGDGEATSAVSVYRYIDEDTMTWSSSHRTVGGEPTDDIPENVIKRHPPEPEG